MKWKKLLVFTTILCSVGFTTITNACDDMYCVKVGDIYYCSSNPDKIIKIINDNVKDILSSKDKKF